MTPQSHSTMAGMKGFTGLKITGLASDSRKVKPGYLFAALAGTKTDAARHGVFHKARAIGLGPGQGRKQISRLHLAAVGRNARDVARGKARIDLSVLSDDV